LREYRYPRFLQIVAAFCLVITLLLAFLSWLAFFVDGMTVALTLILLWLLMGAYWATTLATIPERVVFDATHLHVARFERWRQHVVMAYADIHTVRATPLGLLIRTTHQSLVLSSIHPNICAAIHGELEQRVPVAQAVYQARFATLPVILPAKRVAPLLSLCFGLFLILVAVGMVYQNVTSVQSPSEDDWTLVIVLSALCLALGGGLCYAVLCHYVWRYTFTPTAIQARYSLWTKEWAASDIRGIELMSEEQTYRGFTRTEWHLVINFAHAPQLLVSRSQWGTAFDSSEVAEERLLRQLTARLQALYASSTSSVSSVLLTPSVL
jgi:hypothetical protein